MATNYIYGLRDPLTREIRYVGKSTQPIFRLRGHLKDAKEARTHKQRWLRQLEEKGLAPELVILEEVKAPRTWQQAEREWIAKGKEMGWPLTNLTDGGEGNRGFKFTEEQKRKLERRTSSVTRQRMSVSHEEANQLRFEKGKLKPTVNTWGKYVK